MASSIIKPRKNGTQQELLDSERIFCAEYLANNRNGTAACVAAFPNVKRPAIYARKVLERQRVKAYLGKLLKQTMDEAGLTAQDVLKHLETSLFLDPLHVFEAGDLDGTYKVKSLDEIPEHIRRCITKIKNKTRFDEDGAFVDCWVEVEFMSKDKAQELAMKYLGLLKDAGININVGRPTIDFDKLCDPMEGPGEEDDVIEAKILNPAPRIESPPESSHKD